MNELNLTKNEAYSVAELIDLYLMQFIRDDTDTENMRWLCNMTRAYEKLCEYSGYSEEG